MIRTIITSTNDLDLSDPYSKSNLIFRYMSDGELLDPVTSSGDASIPVSAGNVVMSSGHLADSPHRSYYIWKEPPRQQQQQQGPPQGSYFYVQIPQARV